MPERQGLLRTCGLARRITTNALAGHFATLTVKNMASVDLRD